MHFYQSGALVDFTSDNPVIKLKFATDHFSANRNTINAQTFSVVNALCLSLVSKKIGCPT